MAEDGDLTVIILGGYLLYYVLDNLIATATESLRSLLRQKEPKGIDLGTLGLQDRILYLEDYHKKRWDAHMKAYERRYQEHIEKHEAELKRRMAKHLER